MIFFKISKLNQAHTIFIVWIGVYPSTFLNVSEKTSDKIIKQVLEPPKVELK